VQALTHAGEAELKRKRPERAVSQYEAALRLVPEHRPSLRALADLALEREEKREAAQYLRRLADSSGEKAERAQLYEQMGDIYKGLGAGDEARHKGSLGRRDGHGVIRLEGQLLRSV
jgi:Tfp pilus assembly protein PilF